jgi:CheY-like chemotaxis protein
MHVLLVEDHPINRQLAVELLLDAGVSPDVATDGIEALHMLGAHPPDYYSLVLMDLQMPRLDGYETTKRIRADARLASLSIVAMTAHVTPEERERCLALGMRGHIGKPIDPGELTRLVASFRPLAKHELERTARGMVEIGGHAGLAGIDGLDVRDGLMRTRGRLGLYENLLRQFAAGFRGFGDEVRRLVGSGKADEAAAQAHSLRGVASNLGATRTAACATELEAALRRDEPHESQLEQLEKCLLPLLDEIDRRLGPLAGTARGEAAPSAGEAPPALPGWVPELRRMLVDGDVAAQRLWKQRSGELSVILPADVFAKLEHALDTFEFDVALDVLGAAPSTR